MLLWQAKETEVPISSIFARICTALIALISSVTFVAADSYRLAAGDQLVVRVSSQGIAEEMTVDIDGQIRLADIGGLTVLGKTLDEAEDAIEGLLRDAALYVDPRVSISLMAYAPVVIMGDVSRPGGLGYVPGMTVATAIAMSGGGDLRGVSTFEIERAIIETEGNIRVLNAQISGTVARIARLQAALEGQSSVSISDSLMRLIPTPSAVDLETLVKVEEGILSTEQKEQDALEAFWENEIATISEKYSVFDARIAVQQQILESTSADLLNARELQERGLQTASRLLAAEQRAAEARDGVLELETARINAAQALSNAQRERTRFQAGRRSDNLRGLQLARNELNTLVLRYAREVTQLTVLGEGQSRILLTDGPVDMKVDIRSNRSDRTHLEDVDPNTPVLPGDAVIVFLLPSGDGS